MNRFDFNELIEKAFSMGYEYGQREFGNKENKRKRREWEIQRGIDARYDGDKLGFDDGRIVGERHAKNGHMMEYDARNVAAARALRDKENREDWDWESLNGAINARGTSEKNRFYKNPHKQRYVGKDKEFKSDDYINTINKQRVADRKNKIEEKNSKIASKFDEIIKDDETKRNLKRAGAVLGGATLIGAAAYGIKKHQDKRRAEKEERIRLEEENKALKEALGMKEEPKNK